MTHDELLLNINRDIDYTSLQDGNVNMAREIKALRAVVELHKPELIESGKESIFICSTCNPEWFWENPYPCETIQAIEKELK